MVDTDMVELWLLVECEVKQNNKDLGRTKLALKTDIPFAYR